MKIKCLCYSATLTKQSSGHSPSAREVFPAGIRAATPCKVISIPNQGFFFYSYILITFRLICFLFLLQHELVHLVHCSCFWWCSQCVTGTSDADGITFSVLSWQDEGDWKTRRWMLLVCWVTRRKIWRHEFIWDGCESSKNAARFQILLCLFISFDNLPLLSLRRQRPHTQRDMDPKELQNRPLPVLRISTWDLAHAMMHVP